LPFQPTVSTHAGVFANRLEKFNAARDVTLDELHVELIYPADADAEAFFRNAR
jgi:hypothetical protein